MPPGTHLGNFTPLPWHTARLIVNTFQKLSIPHTVHILRLHGIRVKTNPLIDPGENIPNIPFDPFQPFPHNAAAFFPRSPRCRAPVSPSQRRDAVSSSVSAPDQSDGFIPSPVQQAIGAE